MALLRLYDPYEWFDPEVGRQGVIIHSSQVGGREHLVIEEIPDPPVSWAEVWEKFALPSFIIKGEWVDPEPPWGRSPREHPYGFDAYCIVAKDKVLIFPNKEAADAYQRTSEVHPAERITQRS